MIDFLKKYWFLITFVVTPLGVAIVWVVSIDSRTFSSTEQKVEHVNHVKDALSPIQQQRNCIGLCSKKCRPDISN